MNNLRPLFATLAAMLVALIATAETTLYTGISIDYYVYSIIRDNSNVDYAEITGVSSSGATKYKSATAASNATTPSFITYNSKQYPVRSIDENAFKGCTKMSTMYLGYNMEIIGPNAFDGCTSLMTVKLPSSVRMLYGNVFNNCSKLSDVYSARLTYPAVLSETFNGMPSSVKLHVPNRTEAVESYLSSTQWKSKFASKTRNRAACDFIIGKLYFTVKEKASSSSAGTVILMGCMDSETAFDINLSRQYTGDDGLKYEVTELTDLCFNKVNIASYRDDYVPYNIIIDANAFYYCTGLKTVKTVAAEIKNNAFIGCTALTTAELQGPVTIREKAFLNCTALTNINLGAARYIYAQAFYNSPATSLTIPQYTQLGSLLAFADMPKLRSISVVESNPYLANYGNALYNKAMTQLIFCPPCAPATSGTYLRSMFAPGTRTIAMWAFYKNTTATTIQLPPLVTAVNAEAFRENTTVREIHIGSQVKTISTKAFYGCNKITTFGFAGTTAPTLDTSTTLTQQLSGVSSSPNYRIPPEASSGTFSDNGWNYGSNFTYINENATVDLVDGTLAHGDMGYSFTSTTSYTGKRGSYAGQLEATIINSRSISTTEFNGANCSYVQYVNNDGSVSKYAVTSLRRYALKPYASRYTLVDLRDSELRELRAYSCENLTALTALYTGPVKTIGNYAFDQTAKLQTIVFGEDLTSLGEYAFRGSKSIETITVPTTSVPTVKSTTFDTGLNKSKCNLRVRADMYEKFKAATVWKDFYITDLDGNVPGSDPEYVLKIAGVTVTSSNAGKGAIVPGVSVTFYDTFVTITMDNVSYTDNYKTFIESNYPLTSILLTGSNSVVAAQFLTVTGGNVLINGNDEATLATTASNYVTVDANIRMIANGKDQTCLIFGMKNITSNGVTRAFMGTSGYTTLSLNTSSGEFKSTNYSSNVISGIKKLELYDTELTNCTYSSTATQYGNNGSVKFRNTAATANMFDVNNDGDVNVGDVNYVLNLILNEKYEAIADVNDDNNVNVGDVNAILAEILASSGSSNETTYSVGGVSFKMVRVKGGTFTMGATSEQGSEASDSEKPAHQVTLSDFWIGELEVTEGLWKAVMGSNPSAVVKGDNYPVENMTWDQCNEFITKLNQKTGLGFRLPTEAEWEYAARGGSKSKGYKYAGSNTIGDVAWYSGNSNGAKHPVGDKTANELGLYDMSGNVWEWVSDVKGDYPSTAVTNPTGPGTVTDSTSHVQRGGSWYYSATANRVSRRMFAKSNYNDCGLRLVK